MGLEFEKLMDDVPTDVEKVQEDSDIEFEGDDTKDSKQGIEELGPDTEFD